MTGYIETQTARKIVEKMKEPSEYIPNVGCRCKLCGSWCRVKCVKRSRIDGHFIRYVVCPECGFSFSV